MSWLTNLIRPKIRSFTGKRDIPDNLWSKCPQCEQMLLLQDLADNLAVCRYCQHHTRWKIQDRLAHLFDEGKYQLLPLPKVQPDPLHFRDQKRYTDRLKEAKQKTRCDEAIVVAYGLVSNHPLVVSCFNFDFIGGSMGMAVGEALLIGADKAVALQASYLVIPASGGARMQEGILALMQMPRSVIATLRVKEAGLPFLTLLTNPTTGGVAASFASLGDITLAEPGAIIGFTGARVISETLRQPLPEGFQTAEFQKAHGFVDIIVSRKTIRQVLSDILGILRPAT